MKPIKRITAHGVLQEFEIAETAAPLNHGMRRPKPFDGEDLTKRNERPAKVKKTEWREVGLAKTPLVRKEEEREQPIKFADTVPSKRPLTASTDHLEEEREPTRAEQRALDRDRKREGRGKRHEHLVRKKTEKIMQGFVDQHERRERNASGRGVD